MSKPRVIRRVIKKDAKGRAKVARDRRTMIQMERITARVDRPCEAGRDFCCYRTHNPDHRYMILAGMEFARITSPMRYRLMGGRSIPDPKDYHFECVPPEARPLVRFLVSRNPDPTQ